jgi:hypothetical protein
MLLLLVRLRTAVLPLTLSTPADIRDDLAQAELGRKEYFQPTVRELTFRRKLCLRLPGLNRL